MRGNIILVFLIVLFIGLTVPNATAEYTTCDSCHPAYASVIKAKQHANSDNCLICHKGSYDLSTHIAGGYIGYIVNETTCTQAQCHSSTSGYAQRPVNESHGNKYYPPNGKADCTQCHFANTTTKFPLNNSLYQHDHNFTVEYNFYNYNLYGIPLSTNGGVGKGMFPYYTCTLTCHKSGNKEDEVIGWSESKHARSREGTSDSNAYCARCKSPTQYNASASSANRSSYPIAESNWQGIQCRICHNLHNDTYSGKDKPAFPLAFYNSTLSFTAGRPVYEQVANSTELCEKCHQSGSSNDRRFAGTHKDTGFTCVSCHGNTTLNNIAVNNLTHKFEVKNTTSGVTGCELCHNIEDHTWQPTSQHINKVTCWACHDQTVSRNASGYAVNSVSSSLSYGLYKDTTSNWTTYKLYYTSLSSWALHNISKSVTCSKCHGATSVYNGTIAPALDRFAGNYTGSSTNCAGCHPAQFARWRNSSHTSKLVTRTDAQAKGYPAPPNGDGNWSNVSYAIGGHWKIRYIDNYGYILTNGTVDGRTSGGPGKTQYNVATQTWTDYNRNKTKAYNCAHCHTTGYLQTNIASNLTEPWKTLRELGVYPDGLYDNSLAPGFTGWWTENTIGCEACHGYGGDHMANPSKDNIRNASAIRSNPAICGDCHSRPDTGEYENLKQYSDGVNDTYLNDTLYDSSPMPTFNYSKVGGHHEQWEDWKASVHANRSINCVTCHGGHSVSDPAYADGPNNKTKFINGSVYPAAVNKTCTDCHVTPKHEYYSNNSQCITCHMPRNRKSSDIIDLRSHWFNTSALKSDKNGEIHGYNFQNLTAINNSCNKCHRSQSNEVAVSAHNRTLNVSAPSCTDCHTSGYTSYTVNETNTCRNAGCHSGKEEGHNRYSGADCTRCHFANTTQAFSLNTSLYTHDHTLTVEYNFYNYNLYGIPLSTNGGVGKGMFPYYTCTLTCHKSGNKEDEVIGWNESKHARSRRGPDSNAYCARCKSPTQYNASASSANRSSYPIAESDWQGIQCRICHNLHNNTYGYKYIAFYNSTLSFAAGKPVYEQVANNTELCEKCHQPGGSNDRKFAGTHKDTGFTCTNCHANKTFNNLTHKFEVKNTTSGVTGCEVCHTYPGTAHSLISDYHGNVTCWACHDKTVSRNATTDYVIDNKYGIYKDANTSKWTTYKVSSGAASSWALHNISKSITCSKCHGARSLYSGPVAKGLGNDTSYYMYTLVSNYNLLPINFLPQPAIYANDLLYPSSGGIPGVTKVMKWDSDNQTWISYVYDGTVYLGTNFSVDGPKGYFVKGNDSTAGQKYYFKGREIN